MIEVIGKRTANSKLFSLGGKQYQLQVSLGAIHFRDTGGDWQDIDIDYSESDTDSFTAKFSKLPYLVRMGDDSTKRIYPDRNDLSYWIELGKPFASMGAPTKVGGYWVWNFAHAVIAVKIRPHAVKFGFRLKDSSAPTSITIPFSSQGITRDGNNILHNGGVVGRLQKPTAIDVNNVTRDCDVTFGSETITVSLNTTGLTYPIDIDPTFTVGASSDDTEMYWNGSNWYYSGLSSQWSRAGYIDATHLKYGGGFRWTNITIPQSSTINSAYLTVVCAVARNGTAVNTKITGNDVDNATTWSTQADYQARRGTIVGGANNDYITSAQVDWDGIGAWLAGTSYDSPSIVSVIQEIVNRAGWVSGNALALWWDDYDDRSSHAAACVRYAAAWDDVTYDPPKLTVTYTDPAAPGANMGAKLIAGKLI
jgi:hypothetical protein